MDLRWKGIKLSDAIQYSIGGDWGKDPNVTSDADYVEVHCIRGAELRDWERDKGKTASLRSIKSASAEKRHLVEGDIIVEISGGGPDQPVGRTAYIDENVLENFTNTPIVCTNFFRLIRLSDEINKKFIDYYLKYFYKTGEVVNYQAGSNNLRNLRFKDYISIEIPLPSLNEQNRIVKKLDELFAKTESIKVCMINIPDLFKQFRQSVLHAAFSGKFTEEWRGVKDSINTSTSITVENHKLEVLPMKWKIVKLTKLAKLESGHTPRKTKLEYWKEGKVKWISLQDIRESNGKEIQDTKYHTTLLGIENSSARMLPKGTVVFSRDISVGYVTIMGHEMATSQHFANWICGNKIFNRFLMYAFMASKDHLLSSGQGTTVKSIYMPALKNMEIILPPIEEQKRIVNKVESLFRIAEQLENKFKNLKYQIDILPQAFLLKAFRGELLVQDPSNEPS